MKKPLSFFQALAFQWVNPKAWVVIIGAMAIILLASVVPIALSELNLTALPAL